MNQYKEKNKGKRKSTKKTQDSENKVDKIETKTTDTSGNLDINNVLVNKISSNTLNSLEYKFKPSEFLISLSNFNLNNTLNEINRKKEKIYNIQ